MRQETAQPARNHQTLIISLVLLFVTLALYWPVRNYEFVSYDDPDYVLNNPQVKGGVSLKNIQWAFTEAHASNWHPLTWISHMLDCQFFGVKAGAHHLTNIVLHSLTSVLLFLWLLSVTRALWRSAVVAALFAWHPLHVESVAWISERKDVLSAFFWMLTLCAYGHHASGSGRKWYWITLGLFALGLMAKPMMVTLPCVLLLLDYWPLRRWEQPKAAGALLREKIPFFALSVVSCFLTIWAQTKGGSVVSMGKVPLLSRIGNALVSYGKYLEQTFWPDNLAVIYPHPFAVPGWHVLVALVPLVLLTLLAKHFAKRAPYLPVGWLWFLGTLVPVIGLVQVGSQAMADRYTYLPLIGIFIMLAWGLPELLARLSNHRQVVGTVAGAALLACLFLTSRQLPVWRDSLSLFDHAQKVVPRNHVAHAAMGEILTSKGQFEQGVGHFQKALEIYPRSVDALHQWGLALARTNRHAEALEFYDRALKISLPNDALNLSRATTLVALGRTDEAINVLKEMSVNKPNVGEILNRLGSLYALTGQLDDALACYAKGLSLSPNDANGHAGRAAILIRKEQFTEAVAAAKAALKLEPEFAEAHFQLARALSADGKTAESLPHFQDTLRITPERVDARVGFAVALTALERHEEAIPALTQILQQQPTNAVAHAAYASSLLKTGRLTEAAKHLEESLRINPAQADVEFSLGMLLFRQRRIPEAMLHYEKAAALGPDDADTHYNLALAYATVSRIPEAAASFRAAARCRTNWPAPLNALAWILAAHPDPAMRNGTEALQLATRAVQLSPTPNAMYLNTLAAAQAEAGQFDAAIATAGQAVATANALNQPVAAAQFQARLQVYQQRQPFRDPSLSPPK